MLSSPSFPCYSCCSPPVLWAPLLGAGGAALSQVDAPKWDTARAARPRQRAAGRSRAARRSGAAVTHRHAVCSYPSECRPCCFAQVSVSARAISSSRRTAGSFERRGTQLPGCSAWRGDGPIFPRAKSQGVGYCIQTPGLHSWGRRERCAIASTFYVFQGTHVAADPWRHRDATRLHCARCTD